MWHVRLGFVVLGKAAFTSCRILVRQLRRGCKLKKTTSSWSAPTACRAGALACFESSSAFTEGTRQRGDDYRRLKGGTR